MPYEIDFLAVGDKGKSGDAIAVRWTNSASDSGVMIYDGGTVDAGNDLVARVRRDYGTDYVDHVVCSHPDMDHARGLQVVLENLRVGRLWMHRPWEYASQIRHLFHDGRITDNSLEVRIREALQAAHDLEAVALELGVPISEPFQGDLIGPFVVLSPERNWYLTELVPNFARTPEAKKSESAFDAVMKSLFEKATTAVEWVAETMNFETLDDGGEGTSAQNESSVVLLGALVGDGAYSKVLLTGDAGKEALSRAIAYAESRGVPLTDLRFAQIPHHGARRNVSPSILDKIRPAYAYVSAAERDDDHPRRKVTNAFKRRGASVFATKGKSLRYQQGVGGRSGWGPATEVPFYDQVEP